MYARLLGMDGCSHRESLKHEEVDLVHNISYSQTGIPYRENWQQRQHYTCVSTKPYCNKERRRFKHISFNLAFFIVKTT